MGETMLQTQSKSARMLSEDEKKKFAHRLRRIAGQVAAVERMIDEDAYCVDTLMQIAAATGALDKVGRLVLENHLKTCVRDAMENGDDEDRDQNLEELIGIFRKYNR